ncbi:MAG: flagellin [Pseudomonadota bacterium]
MTRVSSFGQNQALLQGILRNQEQLFEAQRQVNTGKKSDQYQGISDEATTLVASRSLFSRTDSYQTVAENVSRTTDIYDVQLGLILDTARDLRQQLLTFVANNDATGFDIVTAENYGLTADALNTKVGNRFIFGGAAASTPPVVASELVDLQALPTVPDAFDNDQLKSSARVADSVTIEYGILADEIGTDLLQIYRDLADINTGALGPVDGELNPAQVTALTQQIAALDTAVQNIQKEQMLNGLKYSKLQDITDQQEAQKIFLETFISDIEDVDIAEAISRLNNTQTALEASYRVVGQTTRLSIVDFI